jgi:glucose/arabinose dehydrogenase
MLKILFLFFIPFYLYSQTIFKFDNEEMDISVKKIASNMGIVWGMTFVDENKILFTQKRGRFGILNLKTKKVKFIDVNLDIYNKGQAGLLDVQTSPYFAKDRTIYFTYVKNLNGYGVTTLAKAKFSNDEITNIKDILVTKSKTDTTRHFGSRITFDEENHIYFSVGDRGVRPNGQNLSNHAGSIIRLNLNGSIPSDNPFVNKKNILPEIYSYGHRNPQGLFYDKVSKTLFSIEHGPRGGDEINIIKKGLNYGWPVISYGKEYWNPFPVGEGTHKEGMEQPIQVYIPSIAPSSLIVYRGKMFEKWDGNILSGALVLTHLNRIVLNKKNKVIKEDRLLENLNERIRDVIQDKKGKIYISTDNGNIYSLSVDEI